MNVILLSGGSGTRLWPLSNDVRSKQFLKVLRDPEGAPCSMVQRVYSQISRSGLRSDGRLVVATGASQVEELRRQLGCDLPIAVEPERRDTMPAIVLACAFLSSELGVAGSEPVVVMPIDSYVDDAYFHVAATLSAALEDGADIALLGVDPTYPSEKYGYIVPGQADGHGSIPVKGFREKPTAAEAESLIAMGALWNCGVFCFKLGYILDLVEQKLGTSSYAEVRSRYGELEKASFDYGVVERAGSIRCVPYSGSWKDLGTWNTLTEEMADASSGNTLLVDSENVHAVNELGIPMLVMGMRDAVVCATRDGVLVSDKTASAASKPYVEEISMGAPMAANRPWGSYEVLAGDVSTGARSMVNRLRLSAGSEISLQRHLRRTEAWVVVEGEGFAVIDSERTPVGPGAVVEVPAGAWHSLEARTEMVVIEVQVGEAVSDEDVERA